jgi:hypothetical protein
MSRLWSAALTMFVAARAYAQEPEPLAALGIPSLQAPTAAIADLRLWLEEGPVVPHSFLRLQMFPDSTAVRRGSPTPDKPRVNQQSLS